MDITQKAMLAKHTLRMWSARKRDDMVGNMVADKYSSDREWGRFIKRLISSEAMNDIRRAGGESRRHHYKWTLPWQDDGSRILPAAVYFDYMQEQNEYIQRFEKAVAAFAKKYRDHVCDAQANLGGLFDSKDYPTTAELASKFSLSVAINPIPDGKDFRVELTAEEIKTIREDIEQRTAATLETATLDLLERLSSAVVDLRDRISGQDPIFRDSLLGHLGDVVALVPKLNVTGNANIERLCKRAAALINKNDPQVLRKDPNARGKLMSDADVIIKQMDAYKHVLGGAS